MSHLSFIESLGFRRIGAWKLETHGIKPHIEDEAKKAKKSLYAFVVGAEVLYVGKTIGRFSARLSGYEKPGTTQRTNQRINPLITKSQEEVSIYIFQTDQKLEFQGIPLNIAAGLEDTLIERIAPKWNINGKK